MQIRGKEVDFKITRLKDAAAMDSALNKMADTEKQLKKDADAGKANVLEFFRRYIKMMQAFFEDATGVDVLADCEDMEEARSTYFDFLSEIKRQKDAALAPYSDERLR